VLQKLSVKRFIATSRHRLATPGEGIRLSELAGIRYDADDPGRSDVDLWHREITVRGKGRKTRVVKITFDAARSLDRYIRVRARHAQAYRPQLWLGAGNRGR
jgi:site-specific recombinase XerC